MICPNCSQAMHKAKIPSTNPGYFIELDQCPDCGGIWCDRYEAYQVPPKQAQKIDQLSVDLLANDTTLKKDLLCPKDKIALVKIQDSALPEFLSVQRCKKCEGLWFNTGNLAKHRDYFSQRFSKFEKSKRWRDIPESDHLLVNVIGRKILPFPQGYYANLLTGQQVLPERPFILSPSGVQLLQAVPREKKLAAYQAMAQDHQETIEREERFIDGTLKFLDIIFMILRFL